MRLLLRDAVSVIFRGEDSVLCRRRLRRSRLRLRPSSRCCCCCDAACCHACIIAPIIDHIAMPDASSPLFGRPDDRRLRRLRESERLRRRPLPRSPLGGDLGGDPRGGGSLLSTRGGLRRSGPFLFSPVNSAKRHQPLYFIPFIFFSPSIALSSSRKFTIVYSSVTTRSCDLSISISAQMSSTTSSWLIVFGRSSPSYSYQQTNSARVRRCPRVEISAFIASPSNSRPFNFRHALSAPCRTLTNANGQPGRISQCTASQYSPTIERTFAFVSASVPKGRALREVSLMQTVQAQRFGSPAYGGKR